MEAIFGLFFCVCFYGRSVSLCFHSENSNDRGVLAPAYSFASYPWFGDINISSSFSCFCFPQLSFSSLLFFSSLVLCYLFLVLRLILPFLFLFSHAFFFFPRSFSFLVLPATTVCCSFFSLFYFFILSSFVAFWFLFSRLFSFSLRPFFLDTRKPKGASTGT